jgi:3-oxoacyl-[acyl-carrier-protein] synthase-3
VAEETPSLMGAEAAREACRQACLDLQDIDLIINASGTASFEKGLPDGGPLLQKALGLDYSGIPCFSLQNNDLSFMLALEVCAALLSTGQYQYILVVSAEVLSRNLDVENPGVSTLFGDGAAAALLTFPNPAERTGSQLHHSLFQTFSTAADSLQSKLGFFASEIKKLKKAEMTLKMDNEAFYQYADTYTTGLLQELFSKSAFHMENIKRVVPQQLGKNYIHHLTKNNLIPGEKIIDISDRFGFCGAASIPMALYEAVKEKKLTRDDRFLLIGVGAGISVGGMLMTY